jgi:hypothetical protein
VQTFAPKPQIDTRPTQRGSTQAQSYETVKPLPSHFGIILILRSASIHAVVFPLPKRTSSIPVGFWLMQALMWFAAPSRKPRLIGGERAWAPLRFGGGSNLRTMSQFGRSLRSREYRNRLFDNPV